MSTFLTKKLVPKAVQILDFKYNIVFRLSKNKMKIFVENLQNEYIILA